MSAWHVGVTRGSGIVSCGADVLWMGVVRVMRGVGGVCEMCMCLARGGVGSEGGDWMRGWFWALTILWEQGKCWTRVCVLVAVVYVGSG